MIDKKIIISKLKKTHFAVRYFILKKDKKVLTTFIGNFIDKLSYGKIAGYIFFLLICSAIYYWALSPLGHGTDIKNLTFLSSIYFSIITFSSLGYGDILPIGFGKVIASLEVLLGLGLTAIFIGKIASEKQFAMSRLVYTSEHQKRIVKFEKQTIKIIKSMNKALNEHDHEKLNLLSKKSYRFVASLHNYLKFQSNQGDLAAFGNDTSLKRLYKSLLNMQIIMDDAIKTFGIQQRTRTKLIQIVTRVNILSGMMHPFHSRNNKIIAILKQIKRTTENTNKWIYNFSQGQIKYNYRSIVTEKLLFRVKDKIPARPWPKHIHKMIASELEIQNQLVQKCINILIERGI